MVCAIGEPGDGLPSAKEEIGLPGVPDRPAASLLGKFEQGAALAQRDDVVEQLRLGLHVELVGVGKRSAAAHRRPGDSQHVRMGARLARAGGARGRVIPPSAAAICLADSPSAHSFFSISTRSSVQVMAKSSPAVTAEKSGQNPTAGLGNDQLARRIPAPPIYASNCPPHKMSYSTMEKLQYGGSQAQASDRPASTCSVHVKAMRPHLSARLGIARACNGAAMASPIMLTGDRAAIKYLTVPPAEAAPFVSADCRLLDE